MTFISVSQRPGRTVSFGRFSFAANDTLLVHPVRRRRLRVTQVSTAIDHI